jgi:hypothetical protein
MPEHAFHPALFYAAVIAVAAPACQIGYDLPDEPIDTRAPWVDEWQVEAELPAAQFVALSIGDRLTSENFANRGDVEVRYVANTDVITIEMQRFTVASNEVNAQLAFEKMQYWGYNRSSPEKPTEALGVHACTSPEHDTCYIRAYYDGMYEPIRDGANFRVTIPAGWGGDLDIVTSDNLEEGVDTYPDRSDVIVHGLNGNLDVDLDSGNVHVRMDPNVPHYAGCADSQACEEMGYAIGCGCDEPTLVSIANKSGQASNVTVDVGAADNWYSMVLENRGTFSASDDFVCNATIDYGPFTNYMVDDASAAAPWEEGAEINFPGSPASNGNGIRISLISEACANIRYAEDPGDYDADPLPEEKRGELRVCVGCLD